MESQTTKTVRSNTLPVFGVCFALQKILSVHPFSGSIPLKKSLKVLSQQLSGEDGNDIFLKLES